MAAGVSVVARLGNMLLNGGSCTLKLRSGSRRQIARVSNGLLDPHASDRPSHMVQDPRNFALNRLSPMTKTGLEALTGRDELGRRIPAPAFVANLFANSLPSPGKYRQGSGWETPDVTNTDQVLKALGATVFNYQSEAGDLADQLASDRAPSASLPILRRFDTDRPSSTWRMNLRRRVNRARPWACGHVRGSFP